MIYNVTINDKVYEVEVEKGKANLIRTTAVAAEKYGCSWFGYEIVPKYVNEAWERIISSRRMLQNNKIGDIINAERK